MDIIVDPVAYINELLTRYDIFSIQDALRNMVVVSDIKDFENLLEKLELAIEAKRFDKGIIYANLCRKKLDIYRNLNNKYFIGDLNKKYIEILFLIKSKLINIFNRTETDNLPTQLQYINDLIKLFDETNQIKFLNELSDKICNDLPKGPFHETFKAQLIWISEILSDNIYQFKLLDAYNFKKHIINSWANKIRDNIVQDDQSKITDEILIAVKKIEDRLKILLGENYYDGIISITLDTYCKKKITENFDYQFGIFTNEINNNIFKFCYVMISDLIDIFNKIYIYINPRTDILI
jgi:hypothetical protein